MTATHEEETMTDAPQYADPPKRATASLNLTWGLVQIPLQLFTATEDTKLIDRHTYTADGHPVGQRRYDKTTGVDVVDGDTKMMVTVGDKLVELTDDEIVDVTAGTAVDRMRVEIECLIPLADLAVRYETLKIYQARPAPLGKGVANPAAVKAFRLFIDGLAARSSAALIRFAVRGTAARYAVITPDGLLRTLFYDSEVRAARDIPDVDIPEKERAMADMLMESINVRVPPLVNENGILVADYVTKKAAGAEMVRPVVTEETAPVSDDLLAALEASVKAVKPRKPARKKVAA